MNESIESVLGAALSLPHDARVDLAERLIRSLDDEEQKQIDVAWATEICRRYEAYERGDIKAIPGDELVNEMRERFKK